MRGEPLFLVHGAINHTEAGPEVVVEIEAIIPPEPSMEQYFVYYD